MTRKLILFLLFIAWACDNSTNPPEPQPVLELLGRFTFGKALMTTDVWGYVNETTGKEYALVGHQPRGVSIVDVSDPPIPVRVAHLDAVPGFDLKVWKHYLYTVTGGSDGRGSIMDISDPAQPQVVGDFPTAHNIFITTDGYLVAERPQLKIYDLNADPTAPLLLWQGGAEGHDATVVGNRLYDFHGGLNEGNDHTNIYDISDPAQPILLGTISDPLIQYHHSGWPTEDGRFLFICDELASGESADITVWDISQLDDPQKVGFYNDPSSTVHNLYVIGQLAFVSYYTAGFRIFDISDPVNLKPAAEFDTSEFSGDGFNGAFGVYPFSPSGNIYLSDREAGLFIFRFMGN